MLFGRFIRLFSSIPAERFAETVAFLGFFRTPDAWGTAGGGCLGPLFFSRTKVSFLSSISSPFILLDAYLTY